MDSSKFIHLDFAIQLQPFNLINFALYLMKPCVLSSFSYYRPTNGSGLECVNIKTHEKVFTKVFTSNNNFPNACLFLQFFFLSSMKELCLLKFCVDVSYPVTHSIEALFGAACTMDVFSFFFFFFQSSRLSIILSLFLAVVYK